MVSSTADLLDLDARLQSVRNSLVLGDRACWGLVVLRVGCIFFEIPPVGIEAE